MKYDIEAFRRLQASGRLDALRGQQVERVFQVERGRSGIDEEARTVWLSIASEEPYERWWGVEILDMNKDSIRDGRLRMGAPLLVGHDSADQVGVVERFEITSDKKLRVLARFGRSARAEEVFRDVLDGIRRNASVGYIIHDLVLQQQEGDVSTYRVTDWEPLEGSLVAVPADPSVGVGRAATTTSIRGKQMKPDEQAPAGSGVAMNPEAERQRIANLLAAGDEYKDMGGLELARSLILDPSAGVDAFKARMLESMRGASKPFRTAQPADSVPFGAGARHVVSHGKLQVFRGEGGERKAYAFGQFLRAQMQGPAGDEAGRWCRENGFALQQRGYMGSSDSTGGYLVPEEIASELIKNMDEYGVFRQEARVWPMGSDSLEVPTRESGITASFVAADTETSAVTPGFGAVNLLAKEVMAVTNISRATMDDSPISIAEHVASEMSLAFVTLEDQCGFIGDGTSTYGGMQGIKGKLAAGSLLDAAAGHDTAPEIDATDLANLIAKLPQYAQRGAKWYMSMSMYGGLILRLMMAAGGNTVRTLENGAMSNPQFAGFPVVLTPTLPTDLTANYNAAVMLMFGNLRRAAAFGDRQQISLMMDPYTLAGKAQIRLIGYERFHVVNHGVGTSTVAGPVVALRGKT